MKFGVEIPGGPIPGIVRQAVLAEKVGFDSVWWTDHFVGGPPDLIIPELFTVLALISQGTRRVAVGSAVTDIRRRHPATVAQTVATLDNMTNGRTVLGLGAGEATNLQPVGISTKNMYGRLKEGVDVIRELWSSDPSHPVDYTGKYYSMSRAFLQITPVRKPRPPIYIGSYGPKMLELTGEVADGWIPFAHTPETYRAALRGPLADGLRKSGRNLSQVDVTYAPNAMVSKDREEARAVMEPISRTGVAIMPWQFEKLLGRRHPGFEFSIAGVPDLKLLADLKASIPLDVSMQTVIWGTPEDCIGQIEGFEKAGCTHMIFAVRGRNPGKVIRTFASKVMPYFKERRRK